MELSIHDKVIRLIIYYIGFTLFLAFSLVLLHIYMRGDYGAEKESEGVEGLTPNQRRLYDALSFHGYQVKANYPCGEFVLDLALPGHRIAIECESKVIDFSTRKYNIDNRKEEYLRNKGWIVLQLTGADTKGNAGFLLGRIEDAIIKAQAD